jgi:Uma2 family endonuclease
MVLTRHKFSTNDYHQMIELGILTKDDHVELINGEIIAMAAIGSHHSGCTNKSSQFFNKRLSARVIVSTQNPIALEDGTEPEPDIALLIPRDDFYAKGHPTPADIFFVLEIADTSFLYDKEVKLMKYARASIAEAWLLNLNQDEILACRDPSSDGYQGIQTIQRGQTLSLLAFPDITVSVDDLLAASLLG